MIRRLVLFRFLVAFGVIMPLSIVLVIRAIPLGGVAVIVTAVTATLLVLTLVWPVRTSEPAEPIPEHLREFPVFCGMLGA